MTESQAAEITLPTAYVNALVAQIGWARAFEEIALAATSPARRPKRRIDQPGARREAIMPDDARDGKAGKPLILVDRTPGRPVELIVGGGEHHMEELAEWADEIRHYGQDLPPEVTQREKPDLRKAMQEEAELEQARRTGRFSSAPGQTRGVLDGQARPDWWRGRHYGRGTAKDE